MNQRLAVGLCNPGLYSATGLGVEAVWEALRIGKKSTVPNEFMFGPWSEIPEVFAVPDPDASTLGIHRKALRTTVKQTRLAMYGAQLSLKGISDVGRPEWGAYLGLPMVLSPLLPQCDTPDLGEVAQDPEKIAELYLRDIPPFFALTDSNNTVAGHIAILFGLTGPTSVYSPFSDAGMQALIEGALAVAEGDCETALVGAVSPSISPWLALQYDDLEWNGAIPGEAAAFFSVGQSSDVVLTGYSRGFATSQNRPEVLAETLRNALRMAELSVEDVGWILADSPWTDEVAHAQHAAISGVFNDQAPVFSAEQAIGVTGPAQPLVHVLLARHGLLRGLRLFPANGNGDDAVAEESLSNNQAVVVLSCGVQGQVCAVVLEKVAR
ncbi:MULTISPECIES: beta-ketoacyl synthase N-terminal-like domain-containing protein [Mycobacteroides]|uniref:Beta-ketoacyl synthase n=1 Tax=Mycobacteroides chelonae TaxID=1774 RepID=A0AB73MI80_MYCCH|nr:MULTISPECIES: beta-ketoacyl synthase N-terminal-like domain-containing protein [Mycobacteroides]KRQ31512.1 beta-ketoacyl synthase [Mycobacteroides sp. H072]KRQ35727.1 beta-ketoacyl synthase [Mycobacteroides sp. H002]KRQ50729.1 beta-ketoacyl synthase [Mycobacteroides sp. H054]KRQ72508.1 beta-ketoacyl synthase [Mycobacteroides sp. H001]OHT55368.1 beta-ketoacyl synthase [Mycobacteroides chelonae]